jgi:hypothetical protein
MVGVGAKVGVGVIVGVRVGVGKGVGVGVGVGEGVGVGVAVGIGVGVASGAVMVICTLPVVMLYPVLAALAVIMHDVDDEIRGAVNTVEYTPFPTSVVVEKAPPLFDVKLTVALVAGSEPLYATKAVTFV